MQAQFALLGVVIGCNRRPQRGLPNRGKKATPASHSYNARFGAISIPKTLRKRIVE